MTKEQKFYQWFRKQLPINSDITRIETSTMGGVPDTNICVAGQETWVELKCYEGGRVLIRPQQNAWGHRRTAAGGRVFIIAEHASGEVHAWNFPRIMVTTHGKYLHLTNAPYVVTGPQCGKHLINYLFT